MPGHLGIGEHELELHPADGHTPDGMAVWVPWARVLVCGDYLSPVEIPMLLRGRLARRVPRDAARGSSRSSSRPTTVVPGHGEPLDSVRALAILREDVAYLEALPDAKLPLARRTRGAARRSTRPTSPPWAPRGCEASGNRRKPGPPRAFMRT